MISGECPPNVAERQLGKCSQARWLTPASRLLRLYISKVTLVNNFINKGKTFKNIKQVPQKFSDLVQHPPSPVTKSLIDLAEK